MFFFRADFVGWHTSSGVRGGMLYGSSIPLLAEKNTRVWGSCQLFVQAWSLVASFTSDGVMRLLVWTIKYFWVLSQPHNYSGSWIEAWNRKPGWCCWRTMSTKKLLHVRLTQEWKCKFAAACLFKVMVGFIAESFKSNYIFRNFI